MSIDEQRRTEVWTYMGRTQTKAGAVAYHWRAENGDVYTTSKRHARVAIGGHVAFTVTDSTYVTTGPDAPRALLTRHDNTEDIGLCAVHVRVSAVSAAVTVVRRPTVRWWQQIRPRSFPHWLAPAPAWSP
jgi:hypothetical protein